MSRRRCATCDQLKDEDDFAWRNRAKGMRWTTCKCCQSLQRKAWYQNHKDEHIKNVNSRRKIYQREAQEFIWSYLTTHPCVDCGESDPVVLEFDHMRGAKRGDLTKLASLGYSIEVLQEEIAKCEVRCANCHRRKTAKERGWNRANRVG